MGIVEKELASFELSDGTQYRIELNRNGRIHIHIDSVRIDMTVSEFRHFVDVLSEAKENLVGIKDLEG
jgi:hypothetical protein